MVNKNLLIILMLMLAITGCEEEENPCAGYYGLPSIGIRQFVLVDSESKEDLFINETFNQWQLEVWDLSDSSRVYYELKEEEDKMLIRLGGWEREIVDYAINIEDKNICNIHSEVEFKYEDCMYQIEYESFSIQNVEHVFDSTAWAYLIYVE
jgi:hypothetical protein